MEITINGKTIKLIRTLHLCGFFTQEEGEYDCNYVVYDEGSETKILYFRDKELESIKL